MIAWKAQWGILNPESKQFTPYDDTFWSLPTHMNTVPDYHNTGGTSWRADYVNKINSQALAADFIEQSLTQKDYVTLTPLHNDRGYANNGTYAIMFPAFASAYPNTINAFSSGTGLFACYIPSLKRYLTAGNSVPWSIYVYDENINLVFRSSQYAPFTVFQQIQTAVLAYLGPVDRTEFLKPSNYKFLDFLEDPAYFCSDYSDDYDRLASLLSALFANYAKPDYIDDNTPIPDPDPPDGDIDTGGGLPGGYDPDSDEIPWDVTNWLSASDLGMCTVYNPSVSQVKALAARLYSKDFQSGFENYIWGNPIESIIGLSVFPCPIPDGGTATVKSWGLDTGVTMTLAGTTLIHVNCGSLPVPSAYDGYLDYSPYTQAEVYIPYVGFVGLDADDIMGQSLQLHYYIDIISGSATAKLVISNTSTTTVLGQWSCQVGRQIPIGSKDYNDIINAGVQLVASAITAYSGNVIPEIVTDYVNDAGEVEARGYEGGGFNTARFATQMLRAGSSAIMQAKPNITRGSAIASASGQLAVQHPYLILKRPVSAKTNGYGALIGYPTFKYGNIGAYSGFVRCQNIKLDGIGCTDWELSEIFRLCLEGVYI